MARKGLFQHLENLFMDDYHEFKCAHDIQINEWQLYWSPNYVSITRDIVALSSATTILGINLASGNKSANGNRVTESGRTTKSGGTTKGGSAGASTSTQGPLPIFNLVVAFFHELR